MFNHVFYAGTVVPISLAAFVGRKAIDQSFLSDLVIVSGAIAGGREAAIAKKGWKSRVCSSANHSLSLGKESSDRIEELERDITLQELRIECLFPVNEATEQNWISFIARN
jgi:hypothetical protein